MKSIVKNKEVQLFQYPCLKISNVTGNIVLFTSHQNGVVVALGVDNNGYSLCEYAQDFAMDNFVEFTDTVELSN